MSSNLQWALNWDALAARFYLVAVEVWGHGQSPAPEDPGAYELQSYFNQFEAICEEQKIDRCYVCGQSYGAGIVIQYALEYPDRVAGVIATNSRSAFASDMIERSGTRDLAYWQAQDLRKLPFHPCHAKRFPPDLHEQMISAADRVEAKALWLNTEITGPRLWCRDLVAELKTPMLLTNGRYERSFQKDRDFLEASVALIEIADLDCGHSVNIEAAEGFNGAVIDFIARNQTA
ncbi:MAG: alpha/beta hydrolase [Alphaproteobacteria bacterium]|nr:alpha/beta hydrolase [Alphaproteobacteria bacterium]